MNRREKLEIAALLAIGALVLAVTFGVAGCGASARQRVAGDAYDAVVAARVGFITWDAQHLDKLVDAAPTEAAGDEQLGVYARARAPVEAGINVALEAALALSLGKSGVTEADVLADVAQVEKLIHALEAAP